jgi:hypothetical protein
MTDNLEVCPHCGSDACYVVENSPTIKTYSCFGCGFTTNSLMKEGEKFYEEQLEVLPEIYKDTMFKDEDGFDTTTLPEHFINPNGTMVDILRDYEIANDVSVWEYGSRSVWENEHNLWWGDYHPNLLGYKLIADEVFKQIKDKL